MALPTAATTVADDGLVAERRSGFGDWLQTWRERSAALALVVAGVTVGIAGGTSYRAGRQIDPGLRLLDPRRSPTLDEVGAAQPIEYALTSDEANDVVFFGDSTCHDGVDPVLFERLCGLRAYNIGSGRGLGPSGMAVTVMAYLLHHPRPRAIVLCCTPFCFENDSGTIGGDFPERFVANYGPDVRGVVSPAESIAYFVKRGAVSLLDPRAREVRDDPLDGLERETYRTLESKMRQSRGFFLLPGLHGPEQGVARPGPENLVHDDWDRGIRMMIESCRAQSVPFFIRFTPIVSDEGDARDFGKLEAWAQRLESSYENFHVVRPLILTYDQALMWDSIHLNAAGVAKFMPTLAKEVQGELAGKK